jgi:hypothetical protein
MKGNPVKACLVLLVLVATVAPASADIFVFKDLDGFEKCLQTDHLVEKVKTDSGSQTRLLSEAEIQVRCVAAAAKLIAGNKNKDMGLAFVESTRRLSAPDNALEIIGVLVDFAGPACNEMGVYKIILGGLSRPKDGNPVFARTRGIVKRCLKDNAFKKDFLEEKDSADATLAENACGILLEEKLVKACKGAK